MSYTGQANWISGSLWNGEFFVPLSASVLVGTGLSASANSDGRITLYNTAQSFDPSASFITLGPTGSLANERVLTGGPGIVITDYGANSLVAISASLLAGPGIVINQVSNSYAISASSQAQWVEGTPSPRIRTTASVAIGSGSIWAQDAGSNVFFYVSGNIGTNTNISLFGGDVTVSGNIIQGLDNFIVGASPNSNILGGNRNNITGSANSSIIAAETNAIEYSSGSVIIGGSTDSYNTISSSNGSVIIAPGGNSKIIESWESVIAGGVSSRISSSTNVFLGGTGISEIEYTSWSAIVGSYDSNISGSSTSFIGGGNGNTIIALEPYAGTDGYHAILGSRNSVITGSMLIPASFGGNTIINSDVSEISGSAKSFILGTEAANINNSSSNAFIIGGYGGSVTGSQGYNNLIGGYGSRIWNNDTTDFTTYGVLLSSINNGFLNRIYNNVNDGTASLNKTFGANIYGGYSTEIVNNGLDITMLAAVNASSPVIILSGTQDIPGTTDTALRNIILGGHSITYGPQGFKDGFTLGGNANTLGGGINNGGIVGGFNNLLLSDLANATQYSALFAGQANTINTSNAAVILGGASHNILGQSTNTAIVGGYGNYITASSHAFVGGGYGNSITSSNKAIVLGEANKLNGANNAILIGTGLTSSLANSVAIGGEGFTITLSGTLGVKVSGSHYEHVPSFKTTAYTASLSDYIIPIDTATATGGVTVVLPTSIVSKGRIVVIKDVGGQASTKNITISASFGKIDNSTTYTISANYGAATIVCFNTAAGNNTWGLM